MGDYLDINFYIKPAPYNERIVRLLVGNLVKAGSKYNVPRKELRGKKGFPATLEYHIKEQLTFENGTINLRYKNIDYYVDINPNAPSHYKDCEVGHISLNLPGAALNPSRTLESYIRCKKNAEELIEVAKTIWNTLKPKPIYGMGDDENFLPMNIGDKPSEKDIIKDNVTQILSHFPWLSFYGSKIIEKIGKEKLLSAPTYKVEELKEGILIIISSLPESYLPQRYKSLDTSVRLREYFVKTLKEGGIK